MVNIVYALHMAERIPSHSHGPYKDKAGRTPGISWSKDKYKEGMRPDKDLSPTFAMVDRMVAYSGLAVLSR